MNVILSIPNESSNQHANLKKGFTSKKPYPVGGMDGCKAGWLLVYHDGSKYVYKVLPNFSQLASLDFSLARILIDIPIGLTSQNFTRTIEQKMRKQLGNRSSTVFNAPVRPALYAAGKAAQRAENIQLTGKSLSEQSLNILPKIKEVDQYLTKTQTAHIELIESHPEICFRFLAGKVVQSKKATAAGIEERLEILATRDPQIRELYNSILQNTLRKNVQRDDIVDAICLCLVNRLATENDLSILQDKNREDEMGLRVGIGYYKDS